MPPRAKKATTPDTDLKPYEQTIKWLQSLPEADNYLLQRRVILEELRTDHVPRYLFRAWSDQSGGGPQVSINTPKEIIPPAFRKRDLSNLNISSEFYAKAADFVECEARGHYYYTRTSIPTGFSSWSASLHLVLCFADHLKVSGRTNVHVAVMDRYALEGQVLVWHVPHLLRRALAGSKWTNHEYLAYGPVSGAGYVAVPLATMLSKGLDTIFPELNGKPYRGGFRHQLRLDMFDVTSRDVSTDDAQIMGDVASDFKGLALPVALGLLNLRKRPWLNIIISKGRVLSAAKMAPVLACLGKIPIPLDLKDQKWLMKPEMIDANTFPDVQQWMDLLMLLVQKELEKSRSVPAAISELVDCTKKMRLRSDVKRETRMAEDDGESNVVDAKVITQKAGRAVRTRA